MVCKNCGSDLKPGIKYCLECGSYVDEEHDENVGDGIGKIGDTPTYTFKTRSKKKKKKKSSGIDILIYVGLAIIIIVCVVIIVMSLTGNDSKKPTPSPTPEVREDKTLTIENYRVTVPGEYLHSVEGNVIFVSDDVNFTLSYRNTTDDYDAYAKDLKIITKELEDNKYEVFKAEKKEVSGTEFLCYKLKANGNIKYLYLTKASSCYTSLGVIEVFENGNWEEGLSAVAKLNKTVSFTGGCSDYYDDDSSSSGGASSAMEETISSTTTIEDIEEASDSIGKLFGSLFESTKKWD